MPDFRRIGATFGPSAVRTAVNAVSYLWGSRDRRRASHEDAYLRCQGCGWSYPIPTTDADERCGECDGRLRVVRESTPRSRRRAR